MSIKVIAAKAHQGQLQDAEIRQELTSVEAELNKAALSYPENALSFVFIQGNYLHSERKMYTACLFVNRTGQAVTEIHGVLRMKFRSRDALIAKTTVDFDEPFMGTLRQDEALLIHLGIPVKGLSQDEIFRVSAIEGSFGDVRVTAEGAEA